jgi:hypothetical protein
MSLVDRLTSVISAGPMETKNPGLDQLQDFLTKMKEAGVAKIAEYDLPLPDTLGSASQMRLGPFSSNELLARPRKTFLHGRGALSEK